MRQVLLFATALVLCMLLILLPQSVHAGGVYSGTCGENLTWSLDENGTLTISGTGYVDHDMGYRGLFGEVKKVVVEEGITALGENAFNGYGNMTSISLPSTLTEIGGYAFKKCAKLEQIQIPEGVTYIGFNAFEGCGSLKQIHIPDGVTTICGETFLNCGNLEQIDIPADVTQIEGYAFKGCSSLRQIVIPAGVVEIDTGTFSGCTGLEVIAIPAGVTHIHSQAFAGCTGLKTVWIPATVQELALDSFADCDNLQRVMYGGSRGNFLDLVYAQLKYTDRHDDNDQPEDHSLYCVRLFPRCLVTGYYTLDVAVTVAVRAIICLLILGAGGLVIYFVVQNKRKNERIL